MHYDEVLEINEDKTVRLMMHTVKGVPRYRVQATSTDDGYWYGTDPELYTPMYFDESEARVAYARRCEWRARLPR